MTTVVAVNSFPFETSRDVVVTVWDGMAADDDGMPERLAVYSDRTIQAVGTFGGASLTIGGSNDGETYHALHNTQGDLLTITESGLHAVVELPVFIKPRVFGGDGTTSIKVVMSGRRSI